MTNGLLSMAATGPRERIMTIKVAIDDDHSLVRQGLRRYLDTAEDIEVVGEAANGHEALSLVDSASPDIVLLDIRMPEMDGLEAARKIRDRFPKVGVIMLTAYDDRQFVVEAARAEELSTVKERDRKADSLTAREIEVLQLLAFGHTNRDIAEKLFISPDTVKTHLEHIFEKLGASDRTAAVAEALRRRLIE